jgi:potassium-dependent mechanosensitive channel
MTFRSVLQSLRWLVLASILAAALVLAAAPGSAVAQDAHPLDLDATRAALASIDASLKNPNLTDADLQRLRAENDPLGVALQAAIADITPRLAASVKRLAELTPKTKDGAPPPKDVAPANDAASAELESEKAKHDALDANLRAARAMLLQVDDNATRIGARRRELFARETFARTSSVLNPQLWQSVASEIPVDVRVMTALIGGWLAGVGARITTSHLLGLGGLAVLLAAIAVPLHWTARRYIRPYADGAKPTRLRRAIAAAWTLLVLALLPLLWLWAFAYALDAFDLSEPRVQGVLDAFFDAARLVIIFNALGRAMLSPRAPAWRVIPVSDFAAATLFRGVLTIAAIWAAERLLEPAADAVASLNISVAGRGLGAALVALVGAYTLQRLHRAAPAVAATVAVPANPWAPARTVGWMVVIIVLAATVFGHIAFATFLVNQAIFLTILASLLYLADVIVHDGAETLLRPEAPVGARLLAMVGLKRNALAQIAVIIQGMARVVIFIVAAAAVLEPWGVQSQDLFSTLRAAYFGFAVGGVTLSLSSLIAAAAVFGVVVLATRVIQQWLSSRLLPQTRLDPGVGNSISTIFGYLGMIAAVLLGGAQIGLDVQKLALVAGGLSVGIGFGLQTIANNFISGLILLWERGIRVGDWVVVGTDQGFVRRINARATEIETFDRATLIVPNSNFVTGVVKNWVHTDRVGRIIIAINVAYESDVEEVREILIAAAKAQDLVLAIPAPTVQFAEFGDWALKFNLVCFVDDIELAERTRSDMNFDILRRLREGDIRIPYPQFGQLRPGAK